jgi:hypothetical protein
VRERKREKVRKGQSGKDRQDRTAMRGLLGHQSAWKDHHDWAAKTGQQQLDGYNGKTKRHGTIRIWKPGKGSQNRTGQSGQGHQNRIVRTGQPEKALTLFILLSIHLYTSLNLSLHQFLYPFFPSLPLFN